jgi:hypothetical protein
MEGIMKKQLMHGLKIWIKQKLIFILFFKKPMEIKMQRNGLIVGEFFIWPVLNYLALEMVKNGG